MTNLNRKILEYLKGLEWEKERGRKFTTEDHKYEYTIYYDGVLIVHDKQEVEDVIHITGKQIDSLVGEIEGKEGIKVTLRRDLYGGLDLSTFYKHIDEQTKKDEKGS